MTRYGLWKLNEGSGTTIADSDANPINLTIATSTGAGWSSSQGAGWHNAGNSGSTIKSGSLSGTKIATGLAGSTKGVWSFTYAVAATTTTALVSVATNTDSSQFEIYCSGVFWWGNQQFASVTFTRDGTYHHLAVIVDTSLASNRQRVFQDGFQIAAGNGSVAQNRAIDSANALSTGLVSLTCGGDGNARITGDIYSAALYDILSDGQILDHAIKWREDNDIDPDGTTAHLLGASSNSGTNDGSTTSTDTVISGTATIGASGIGRVIELVVGYEGNSPTTVTFNGINMNLLTSSTSGSQGVAVYYLFDADLPSGAGSYAWSVTVGTGGTATGSPRYMTGILQSVPTNYITNTGTGTSIAGTLPSNASVGSIVTACIFDDTTADTPTVALPQTVFPKVNGTGTGNTHTLGGSARYINTSSSTTMTFSGLTNASQKLLIAVEYMMATPGPQNVVAWITA